MKTLRTVCLAAAMALALAAATKADIVTIGASNDTWIRSGASHTVNGVGGTLDARLQFVPYIQFDLSGLNIASISSATLTLSKVPGGRNDTWTSGRFLLYGLTDMAGNTAQNWHETADFDPTDATNGLDFRNVGAEWTNSLGALAINASRVFNLDQESGASVVEAFAADRITVTGADLVVFLQQRVDANGLVTFMTPINANDRGWGIASKESTVAAGPSLTLDFTVVPEPSSLLLLALSSSLLIARCRRS